MPYRPTERTEARRAAARERIVRAAHALIARGGYREAQVVAVAAGAGVATGTVYRHFPSKADLFAEVFRRASQREVDATREAAEAAGGSRAPGGSPPRSRPSRAGRCAAGAWPGRSSPSPSTRPSRSSAWPSAAPTPPASRTSCARASAAGELAPQNVELTAAALVGALGEALVGPLSPIGGVTDVDADALVADLVTFCLRSVTEETH